MSKVVLVLGESGSGKSRSIKNLPPEQTFLVNGSLKDLPFKGASKIYTEIGENNPKGNMISTEKLSVAAKYINYVNKSRPEIKYIVLDDNQYFSLFTFVRRIDERAYFDKFTDIAVNLVEMAQLLKKLRNDITVFILNHIETGTSVQGTEQIQAKTMGKFVKEKVTYEGLFTTVLLCDKEAGKDDGEINHFFWTRQANSTVKTPEGMFDEQKIPNDLLLVADAMKEYYN